MHHRRPRLAATLLILVLAGCQDVPFSARAGAAELKATCNAAPSSKVATKTSLAGSWFGYIDGNNKDAPARFQHFERYRYLRISEEDGQLKGYAVFHPKPDGEFPLTIDFRDGEVHILYNEYYKGRYLSRALELEQAGDKLTGSLRTYSPSAGYWHGKAIFCRKPATLIDSQR